MVATIVAVATVSTAASGSERRGHVLLSAPRQQGMATLYARWPAAAINYPTAMTRYRYAVEREKLPPHTYPFILAAQPPYGGPWTWTAPNGSHVRRMANGAMHLSLTDLLSNWFLEIDCRDAGWPVFSCDDGIERIAAAPRPETLVIDGVEFSRILPSDLLPPAEASALGLPASTTAPETAAPSVLAQ